MLVSAHGTHIWIEKRTLPSIVIKMLVISVNVLLAEIFQQSFCTFKQSHNLLHQMLIADSLKSLPLPLDKFHTSWSTDLKDNSV